MIEVYETDTFSSITDLVARMKDLCDLLCSVTPASIYRVDADDDDAFDAIIFVGGDRFIRMAAGTTFMLAAGYMSGETFTATQTFDTAPTTGAATNNNSVTVINNGDVWDLNWRNAPSGNTSRVHLRAARIKSSTTGQTVWAVGLYQRSDNNYSSFPASDYVLVDGAEKAISYASPDASGNIPSGKIMVFPSLLCTSARIDLGVPTIGKQRTYFKVGPGSIPLDAYTEFKINAAKFVSLGAVAIRSE